MEMILDTISLVCWPFSPTKSVSQMAGCITGGREGGIGKEYTNSF